MTKLLVISDQGPAGEYIGARPQTRRVEVGRVLPRSPPRRPRSRGRALAVRAVEDLASLLVERTRIAEARAHVREVGARPR